MELYDLDGKSVYVSFKGNTQSQCLEFAIRDRVLLNRADLQKPEFRNCVS